MYHLQCLEDIQLGRQRLKNGSFFQVLELNPYLQALIDNDLITRFTPNANGTWQVHYHDKSMLEPLELSIIAMDCQ